MTGKRDAAAIMAMAVVVAAATLSVVVQCWCIALRDMAPSSGAAVTTIWPQRSHATTFPSLPQVLGPIVFGDKAKMAQLNAIVWPAIRAKIEAEIARCDADPAVDVVVFEAAILLEAGWEDLAQAMWVLCVEPGTAVERIMQRNGLSEADARMRVESQMTNEERLERAGPGASVLWNSGTLEVFEAAIEASWALTMASRGGVGAEGKA